ncbi:MAG TPA: cupin domain-containing protein [Chloroflexota bacterium]|nr:cupin domain-containing protein [Chloroflexota bacterium]
MDQRTALLGVGHTITIAAGREDTGGAFALLDYELAPGFGSPSPLIHHREDEAAYVLEGRLLVRVGETERLVGPGEFIFLPRGIGHAQSNPGPAPARFLVFLVPAGFEQYFPDLEALLEGGAQFSPETIGPLLAHYGVRSTVET